MTTVTNMPEQALGNVISFTTKNSVDATKYQGVVTGNVNYFGARAFSGATTIDILAYHQRVRQSSPNDDTIPNNAEDCNYFLLSVSNGDKPPLIYPFAYEWVTNYRSSEQQVTAMLKVVAQRPEIDDIVAYIRKLDLRCTVISIS